MAKVLFSDDAVGSHTASISIQARMPAIMAGKTTIWLEATGHSGFTGLSVPPANSGYVPEFHEIKHIWVVRGKPLNPYGAVINMPTAWNDANIKYGMEVAFHLDFDIQSNYFIDLWAVGPNGETAIASTVEIVLTSVAAAYPGVQTIVYSNDPGETWAGKPSGAQEATSYSQIQTMIDASTAPTAVLFKRGQTADENARVRANGTGQWLNRVDEWGNSGDPKAIIAARRSSFIFEFTGVTDVTHFTCANISFLGGWDSTSETGDDGRTPFYLLAHSTPCHYSMVDIDGDGLENFWGAPGLSVDDVIIWAGLSQTNWRDYGMFIHDAVGRMAIIGSTIAQHVDALSGNVGGAGKNGFYNDHGPCRWSYTYKMYMSCVDLFSRNGWSPLAPDNADQPCLRGNSNINGQAKPFATFDRVACEGGLKVMTLEGHDTGVAEYDGNYVLNRMILLMSAKSFVGFIFAEYGGITVENVLGIVPDTPVYHTNGFEAPIHLDTQNSQTGNLASPIRVNGFTAVNLRSAANDPGWGFSQLIKNDGVFTDVVEDGNVLHAPNIDTPNTSFAPIDTTTQIAGMTPRHKGPYYNPFGQETGQLSADVADGGSFTLPYPAGTDQTYWQNLPASDNLHRIIITAGGPSFDNPNSGNNGDFHQEHGEISVTFEASQIRVTNTSSTTWANGMFWRLKLDRKSQLTAIPGTYATPANSYPICTPQAGSAALNTVDVVPRGSLLILETDTTGTRGGTPSAGAVQP